MNCVSKRLETDILSSWKNEADLPLENCFRLNFNYLVPNHLILTLEYNILNTYLRNTLAELQKKEQEIDAELIAQLLAARKIAIFLSYLYEKKLNVPREAAKFRDDELFYRTIFNQSGSPLQNQLQNPWETVLDKKPDSYKLIDTQTIRNKHVIGNWIRVFAVRGRRVLNGVRPFITDSNGYHQIIGSFEEVANPLFSYFSWAFYVPRLITNTGILLKHVLPHPWMSKEEENLAWGIRLRAQIQRRWFELANDSVWLASGLLCCFLLIGPLVPAASYLVAALYAYDILLASLRAFIELRRLYQLRQEYADSDVPIKLREELNLHIAYERRRLYINVGYMTALTVAIVLTIPILALSGPLFPLVGAALLVLVTLISFIALKLNEKTKPVTQTPAAASCRFFKATEPCAPFAKPVLETPTEADLESSATTDLNPAACYA